MPGKFLAEYTVKGFDKTSSDTCVLIVRGSLFIHKIKKKKKKKKKKKIDMNCYPADKFMNMKFKQKVPSIRTDKS
jgi:hypothetical protein